MKPAVLLLRFKKKKIIRPASATRQDPLSSSVRTPPVMAATYPYRSCKCQSVWKEYVSMDFVWTIRPKHNEINMYWLWSFRNPKKMASYGRRRPGRRVAMLGLCSPEVVRRVAAQLCRRGVEARMHCRRHCFTVVWHRQAGQRANPYFILLAWLRGLNPAWQSN
jgi:hypothetical protein